MEQSHRLRLPYIMPSQAQKHVTHNEALQMLDMLVQCRVNGTASTPPENPAEGEAWIVEAGTAGWAGKDGAIAAFQTGGWLFHQPEAGWTCHHGSADALWRFDGATWSSLPPLADQQNLGRVGIGASADAANPLTVAGPGALFTHAGASHRITVNKAQAGDTASLLFQSGWSGRAEMGLTGTENFAIKVSADGQAFADAMQVDAVSARPRFPNGLDFGGAALSVYENGTFTPRLAFGGTETGIAYGEQTGIYVRIGALVFLQIAIKLTAKGSATGNAEILGLPLNANPPYYPGSMFVIGGCTGLTVPVCRTLPGSKLMLGHTKSTGFNFMTDQNFTDAANIKLAISYIS